MIPSVDLMDYCTILAMAKDECEARREACKELMKHGLLAIVKKASRRIRDYMISITGSPLPKQPEQQQDKSHASVSINRL